jgi:hypothetical protein
VNAVPPHLRQLIQELQSLKSLEKFSLAGGTNLALRYNHRYSQDIDLFTNEIIGIAGFKAIAAELKQHFAEAVFYCELENEEAGEQYCFLKTLMQKQAIKIKVEFIQNMHTLDDTEIVEGIRLISVKDIGLMKLMSAANRKAHKDIYDLRLIADEIPLPQLLTLLDEKRQRFSGEEYKCLFDLDEEVIPSGHLQSLLEYDNIDYKQMHGRPNHSTAKVDIIEGGKPWKQASGEWRRMVRACMRENGMDLPPATPVN